jgi:hypothetical protein
VSLDVLYFGIGCLMLVALVAGAVGDLVTRE